MFRNKKGYTLIELLVVIGILVTFTLIVGTCSVCTIKVIKGADNRVEIIEE